MNSDKSDIKHKKRAEHVRRYHIKRRWKQQQAIIKSLTEGCSIVNACDAAECSRMEFYRWQKENHNFRDTVEDAKDSRIHMVEDALYRNCVTGDTPAIKYYLDNRSQGKYKSAPKVINNNTMQQSVVTNNNAPKTEEEISDARNRLKGNLGILSDLGISFSSNGKKQL